MWRCRDPRRFVRALFSQAIGDNTDIKVSLPSSSSQQIQELVGAQSVDFGDYDPPVHHTPQCYAYRIETNCLCVLTRHHPFTRFNSISINSLERAPRRSVQRRNGQPDFSALATICDAGQCLALIDPLTTATEREMNSTQGAIVFRALKERIFYEYAMLTPLHRPTSQLAERIKSGWQKHRLSILIDMSADPVEVIV